MGRPDNLVLLYWFTEQQSYFNMRFSGLCAAFLYYSAAALALLVPRKAPWNPDAFFVVFHADTIHSKVLLSNQTTPNTSVQQ